MTSLSIVCLQRLVATKPTIENYDLCNYNTIYLFCTTKVLIHMAR